MSRFIALGLAFLRPMALVAIGCLACAATEATAAGADDQGLTDRDRHVIAIAETVARPKVLATTAALEEFGRDALKLPGRHRLSRLAFILNGLFLNPDDKPYRYWSHVLHREAMRAHDRRYEDIASIFDMVDLTFHGDAKRGLSGLRALKEHTSDPLVRAGAWLEAVQFDRDVTPQDRAAAVRYAIEVAADNSDEDQVQLYALAMTIREQLFSSLAVKSQSALKIFEDMERFQYPQDGISVWVGFFSSALNEGDFPLAEHLYRRYQELAPSLAVSDPDHAAEGWMCVNLAYQEGDSARVLRCFDGFGASQARDPRFSAEMSQIRIISLIRLGRIPEARQAYQAFSAASKGQDAARLHADFTATIEALFRASRNGSVDDLAGLMDRNNEVLRSRTRTDAAMVDVLSSEYDRNSALTKSVMRMQGSLLAVCALAIAAGLWALRSQMRLARRLKKAKAEAEAANEAKSQFLATISHEIRTPLNGVLGLSQVMANDDLSPRQADRLIMIRRSGANLMALLNDILDLSRIEAGHLELDEIAYDIRDVAEGLVGTFQPQAQAKGLKLSMLLEPQALGSYRGDVVRLNQIVSNLVANAVKFTEAGEISITIGHSEAGLEIKVRDTGPGMDEETAKRIFARFVQGDASATRRYGGAGLGLAIARELCEAMGGRLTVTSNLGEGSVFVLHLPQPRVVHLARKTQGADPVSTAFAALKQRRLRVLAAEDDAISATVLKSLLDEIEAETVMVDDGMKAVAAFEAGAFDLVLLDLEMPALDGLDAVRLMRAQEEARGQARTPMLAVTAAAMAHQLRTCLSAGFDDRLTKPLLAEEVWVAIFRGLAGSKAGHPWAAPTTGLKTGGLNLRKTGL